MFFYNGCAKVAIPKINAISFRFRLTGFLYPVHRNIHPTHTDRITCPPHEIIDCRRQLSISADGIELFRDEPVLIAVRFLFSKGSPVALHSSILLVSFVLIEVFISFYGFIWWTPRSIPFNLVINLVFSGMKWFSEMKLRI